MPDAFRKFSVDMPDFFRQKNFALNLKTYLHKYPTQPEVGGSLKMQEIHGRCCVIVSEFKKKARTEGGKRCG